MGKRCVVGGCGATTRPGVALFLFPHSTLSCQWNEFVRSTREKWESHTKYSAICSQHFHIDQFQNYYEHQFGFAKLRLNDHAVPTIPAQAGKNYTILLYLIINSIQ